MKSFKQKAEEKAARLKAERLLAEAKAKDAREWKEWYHARELEQQAAAEWELEEQRRAEQEEAIWKLEQRLLSEQEENAPPEKINTGVGMGHESTWQLTWEPF